jgi:hypothetical protein
MGIMSEMMADAVSPGIAPANIPINVPSRAKNTGSQLEKSMLNPWTIGISVIFYSLRVGNTPTGLTAAFLRISQFQRSREWTG